MMGTEKRQILIVDDVELNRAILAELFQDSYEVLEAENGCQALELLEAHHDAILIVLLDIIMPVMDGFEMLQNMAHRPWKEELPVVLITSENSDHALLKGYELGVSDIINKPFNPNIVKRRVDNTIELYLHKRHLEALVRQQVETLEKQTLKLNRFNEFIIDTLSTVVEFRSCESGTHIRRVREITRLLLESLSFRYPEYDLPHGAIDKVGDPFPEATYQACKNADAVLFSAVGDPKFDNDPTAKVRPEQGLLAMRKKLGLFANIRPVQTFKCLLHKSPLRAELVDGADFLCIRELTGGMYFGEKYQDNDKAYDTNMYTRPEIERILKVGFEYAMKRNKHLTVVDKANVLASSRLWRQIAREMAPDYPEVTTDYMYVDNAAMRMIQEPKFFDVMVTENTFGDILTDEGSCISGSMGLLPSASTGESTPVFEPIHGSWPQAKGLNIANPLAQILSVAMLFEYFGLKEEGALVREAVDASLDANVRTPEIQAEGGAKYGTKEVGAWIVDYIKH